MYKGRFAPTPSGLLHVGNALTYLLAWLHARKRGGIMVLRCEDLDRARTNASWWTLIEEDLHWLGLDWDEGPDRGGPAGPYLQSERTVFYESALAALREGGHVYPCFCSRKDVRDSATAPHGLATHGPDYPGTCRHLTPQQVEVRRKSKHPALRFAMPDHDIEFADLALGPQTFAPPAGGDFILQRADGVFAYQLAVAVDDATMGVTDVIRGADLLDSTPRQLAILAALKLSSPRYGHVPLVTDACGERLAKHAHAHSVRELRTRGQAPTSIIGALAHLAGLIPAAEPVTPAELISCFDLASVRRGPLAWTEPD
ncbi:MAG: tRNA glutamyl-Q(34) synthetase GluQRS [Firmicutes bacterium]|nr:tRNA glutamyl-Q(34) synthetase GluQRS [Bacillota bacterium]